MVNRVTKIGCIVQGDLRVPVAPILAELRRHCDFVVLSTWEGQEPRVPADCALVTIYNKKPPAAGITNRNLQRLSTAAGLAAMREAHCTHVLKWRTDILPTKLRRVDLLQWAGERGGGVLGPRIVMSAFRNLTALPDWFSSFPDLFAFGGLEAMELLWGDAGFDYTKPFNVPDEMRADCGWTDTPAGTVRLAGAAAERSPAIVYDAHVEFYALFRARLQRHTGRAWTHPGIARDVLRLIDHERLGACWFRAGANVPFRSIVQATYLPWWTEVAWLKDDPPAPQAFETIHDTAPTRLERWASNARIARELALQMKWWSGHSRRHKAVLNLP